jgi:hypothetical protein
MLDAGLACDLLCRMSNVEVNIFKFLDTGFVHRNPVKVSFASRSPEVSGRRMYAGLLVLGTGALVLFKCVIGEPIN